MLVRAAAIWFAIMLMAILNGAARDVCSSLDLGISLHAHSAV